eukprot:1159593-Pelagomonas_calceolata.AAC.1
MSRIPTTRPEATKETSAAQDNARHEAFQLWYKQSWQHNCCSKRLLAVARAQPVPSCASNAHQRCWQYQCLRPAVCPR